MITGAHMLLYSKDAEKDRAIDIGHGSMIFAMPPSEAAVHPIRRPSESARKGRE